MGNDIDHREETANPYASPQSEQTEEKSRRRKTKWRIIPTMLLMSLAFTLLLYHGALSIRMAVRIYNLMRAEENYHTSEDSFIFVLLGLLCFLGTIGDVTGLFGAINCWKGRWKRSLSQIGCFFVINLLFLLVVFLMY